MLLQKYAVVDDKSMQEAIWQAGEEFKRKARQQEVARLTRIVEENMVGPKCHVRQKTLGLQRLLIGSALRSGIILHDTTGRAVH